MPGRRIAAWAVVVAVVIGSGCSSSDGRATSPAEPPSTTTSTAGPAVFTAAVRTVTEADVAASWRPGCPLPVDQLRSIDLPFWGFDGDVHHGRIIVGVTQVEAVTSVLRDLFEARYPIHRMQPVDRYGGSDDASVAADNTSAFNCRLATGGTGWSEHAYGRAVDLNPLENPYVRGTTILPAQSAALLDRTRTDRGMVHEGDAAVVAFAKVGWPWGGHWRTTKDYQHFSATGR